MCALRILASCLSNVVAVSLEVVDVHTSVLSFSGVDLQTAIRV